MTQIRNPTKDKGVQLNLRALILFGGHARTNSAYRRQFGHW